MRAPEARVWTDDGLVVDSFAGGGGASLGIEWALGRSPDIAINHDREAIALHAANHPTSKHYPEDVWKVDPVEACGGRPVTLMWLSPDCKHFSKAKGGKPVSKRVRGLAWVAVRWAVAVRPRIIALENVKEFQGWSPLHRTHSNECAGDRGDDCPRHVTHSGRCRGETGRRCKSKGCHFGKPVAPGCHHDRPIKARAGETFRAFVGRLRALGYVVEWRELRACDYGSPTIRKRFFLVARCDGLPIRWPAPTHGKGRPDAWHTAAECIQWEIPCPSIFERKKPLADNTLRRIARGIKKFVVDCPTPFIVGVGGRMGQSPERSLNQPYQTITAKGDAAIVVPHIVEIQNSTWGGKPISLVEPMRTITAHPRGGGHAIVAPYLVPTAHAGDARAHSLAEPIRTITGSQRGDHAIVAPCLVPRYGERKGQEPRTRSVESPMPTIVPTQNGAGLVSAFLAKHYTGVVGSQLELPVPTVTTIDHNALVTAHIKRDFGTSVGAAVDSPLPTITADGGGHASLVRALLVAYYGNEKDGASLFDPMRTLSTRDRFGLVTVAGLEYEIADIGMRMLAPRELYRAQGFPDTYNIDIQYNGKPMTKTAQVRMVGNSVCPDLAAAIVRANVPKVAEAVA